MYRNMNINTFIYILISSFIFSVVFTEKLVAKNKNKPKRKKQDITQINNIENKKEDDDTLFKVNEADKRIYQEQKQLEADKEMSNYLSKIAAERPTTLQRRELEKQLEADKYKFKDQDSTEISDDKSKVSSNYISIPIPTGSYSPLPN